MRVTDGVGGFVRSSAVDSRPGLGGGAVFELEIPSARLQTALARLSQLASVRSRTESSQDVTEQVTFMRNRVVALRAERRSLLRQLAAAPSLAETARLRDRLRSIDARLRDAKQSRAALRRRTAYSAVSLQIVTERPREDSGGGAWTPGDALDDAARVLEVAAGVTLVALAVLLPLGLLALLGWPLARARAAPAARAGARAGRKPGRLTAATRREPRPARQALRRRYGRPMSANLASNLIASAQRAPDDVAMKLDDLELTFAGTRRAQRACRRPPACRWNRGW